jgi:hypothetical protein
MVPLVRRAPRADPLPRSNAEEVTIARVLLAAVLAATACASCRRAHAADGPPSAGPVAPAPPAASAVVAHTPRARAADALRAVRLEVQLHAAVLRPDPAGLLTLDSGTAGQARWDEVEYGEAFGGRFALTFEQAGRDVRLTETWWGTWEDERLVSGTIASTSTPGGLLNVTSTTLGVRETAKVGGFSVTSLKPWSASCGLAARWGWGGRYTRFREEAAFLFPTTVPPANAAVFQAAGANGLLAAEVVAEARWRLGARLEVRARGSVFAGWMRRSARLFTVNVQPPPLEPDDRRDDLGYGAEAEVAVAWRAFARGAVTVGYGVLLLGPVSRAHEAYDFSNVASNDLGPVFGEHTLVVQRVFVGLEVDL